MQSSSQIITTNKPTPSFFTGWMPFLSPDQHCQTTKGKVILQSDTQYTASQHQPKNRRKQLRTIYCSVNLYCVPHPQKSTTRQHRINKASTCHHHTRLLVFIAGKVIFWNPCSQLVDCCLTALSAHTAHEGL